MEVAKSAAANIDNQTLIATVCSFRTANGVSNTKTVAYVSPLIRRPST